MSARRLPVGRLTALAAAIAAALIISRASGTLRFHTLRPGVEFGIMRGEPYCRRGSPDIAVLRLDPRHVRLRMHHYTSQPEREPLSILEWQRRIDALAVFNAGQYYPDYSYMGIFVADGHPVSRRLHPEFKAALVDAPRDGGAGARVLDLEHQTLDPGKLAWREVAQSFMLFDAQGRVRVRRSPQIANRTAVAEDREGHILVFTTEGGYTLFEFAGLLKAAPLHLSHAMSMDGGDEAVLCVKVGEFRYASLGRWEKNGEVPNPMHVAVPLPAVIEVQER